MYLCESSVLDLSIFMHGNGVMMTQTKTQAAPSPCIQSIVWPKKIHANKYENGMSMVDESATVKAEPSCGFPESKSCLPKSFFSHVMGTIQ